MTSPGRLGANVMAQIWAYRGCGLEPLDVEFPPLLAPLEELVPLPPPAMANGAARVMMSESAAKIMTKRFIEAPFIDDDRVRSPISHAMPSWSCQVMTCGVVGRR